MIHNTLVIKRGGGGQHVLPEISRNSLRGCVVVVVVPFFQLPCF